MQLTTEVLPTNATSVHAARPAERAIEGLGIKAILFWAVTAAFSFLASYAHSAAGLLTILYLFALLQLGRATKWRLSFYPGLGVGLVIAAVHLGFFWTIFSFGAVALWVVFAIWLGFFALLARCCFRWSTRWGWLAMPFLWTGLEYFRGELYYLKFSWLTPGYAFAGSPWQAPLSTLGMYGTGFLLMSVAALSAFVWQRSRLCAGGMAIAGAGAILGWGAVAEHALATDGARTRVHVAGVQMEFPTEKEVLDRLNALIRKEPDAELLVLSENTFSDPIPEKIKDWCRNQKRYLIAGGKEPVGSTNFRNTAFVVAPSGQIVFKQTKAVPIQFFKDGLPASEQRLWDSPWGKIGICICYDLSYSRVTDRLVALGAQALVVPTMDVADWGERQHLLHARVAPVRAAEYRIPVLRVASSGVSQLIDKRGRVLGSAPFPGEGAMFRGYLELAAAGSRPLDRWLAPVASGITLLIVLVFAGRFFLRENTPSRPHNNPSNAS